MTAIKEALNCEELAQFDDAILKGSIIARQLLKSQQPSEFTEIFGQAYPDELLTFTTVMALVKSFQQLRDSIEERGGKVVYVPAGGNIQ